MNKRVLLILLALALVTGIGVAGTAQILSLSSLDVQGYIFGRDVAFDNKPFIHEEIVYVPLEETAERFSYVNYTSTGVPLLGRQPDVRLNDIVAYKTEGWISFENGVYWRETVVGGETFDLAYRKHMEGIESEPIAITYKLGEGYSSFFGKLGIEDLSLVEDRPAIFRVYGDGDLIYEAELEFGQAAVDFDIDITGVNLLKLEMSAVDDRQTGIMSLIEPRLRRTGFAIDDARAYTGDEVYYDGEAVNLQNPLLEEDGELYISAADLAGLFNVPWAYDSSAKELYIGEDPADSDAGRTVKLDTANYHFVSIWESVTDPGNYQSHRVGGVTYDNTYRRSMSRVSSRVFWVSYELDREYRWFSVKLGISDDTVARHVEPVFQIWGDGEVLYETRLRYREPAKRVLLDVSEVSYLSYRVYTDIDHFSSRVAIIDPVMQEKAKDDLPEPDDNHPSLETDVLGTLEGRYYERSRPFGETPSVVTDFGTFDAHTFLYSSYVGDWEGKVVHVGEGDLFWEYDGLEGNIALIKRRFVINRRVLYAQLAGAIGVIHYNNSSGIMDSPNLSNSAGGVILIPAVAISLSDGEDIADRAEQDDIVAKVEYGDNASGYLIDCGPGVDESDYPAEVAGNIALVEENSVFFDRRQILPAAVEAGASGVVFYNDQPGFMVNPDTGTNDLYIPVMGISREDGLDLKDRLEAGDPVYVEFQDALE